jgi:hypothetical protein
MLNAVSPEGPDGRTGKRREQHAPNGVANGVPESALERLENVLSPSTVFREISLLDGAGQDQTCKI